MKVTFLGTSAGTPTKTRGVTAQLIRLDHGDSWMLDCGEGTQHAILHQGQRARPIERILITHLHGDHCYGLPGILSLMAIQGRVEPVEIIGPPGVRELVETVLRLSVNHLPYALNIEEIQHPGQIWERNGWTISAWPLVHRVPSFGFVVNEPMRLRRFHPERAFALGLLPGPHFGALQRGHTVTLPDGRTIEPDQVSDPQQPGRKLVLLGDTADSSAIYDAGQHCNLLIHEATFAADRTESALQWGHSTTTMAGACAKALGAKRLAITHFSARYDTSSPDDGRPTVATLRQETMLACPATEVIAADDGTTVDVD